MRWESEPWLKVYKKVPSSWGCLAVVARGIGTELLKYADDDGRIMVGDGSYDDELASIMGAKPAERGVVRRALAALVADGYLVLESHSVLIRNYATAQKRSSSAERMARLRSRDRDAATSESDALVTGSDVTKASPVTGEVTHVVTEVEVEIEEEKKQGDGQAVSPHHPVVSDQVKKPPGKKPKAAPTKLRPVPDDWEPKPEHVERYMLDPDIDFDRDRIRVLTKRFINMSHEKAWVAADWHAKFRNFLLNEREWHPDTPRYKPPLVAPPRPRDDIDRRVEESIARGDAPPDTGSLFELGAKVLEQNRQRILGEGSK